MVRLITFAYTYVLLNAEVTFHNLLELVSIYKHLLLENVFLYSFLIVLIRIVIAFCSKLSTFLHYFVSPTSLYQVPFPSEAFTFSILCYSVNMSDNPNHIVSDSIVKFLPAAEMGVFPDSHSLPFSHDHMGLKVMSSADDSHP